MDPTMLTPQTVAPTQMFYFYAPDGSADSRKKQQQQQQQQMMSMMPALPTTPAYSRPGSAAGVLPRPQQKFVLESQPPRLLLETEGSSAMATPSTTGSEAEFFSPATPPLSTTGSAISSPESCDMLSTPLNPMFSGLDGFDTVKEEADLHEQLASFDWPGCASPPVTPVYLPSQFQGKTAPANSVSENPSRPSLSPSPSYTKSVSSEKPVDFCDPRNLTVAATAGNSANPTLAPEFPALGGTDEDQSLILGDQAVKTEVGAFAFNTSLQTDLPTFNHLDDLDSEGDDFSGIPAISIQQQQPFPVDIKRSRSASSSSSVDDSFATNIEDLEEIDPLAVLPMTKDPSEDAPPSKKAKKNDGTSSAKVAPASSSSPAALASCAQQDQPADSNSASPAGQPGNGSASESTPAPVPAPAPQNRRGRKQSLTEDPSKTFKCDLCSRRFRRQEHLKRHHRSLHTTDKPFQCQECGKSFSRSDNLAQHARTHGSGAIVMSVIEDPDRQAAVAAASAAAAAAGMHPAGPFVHAPPPQAMFPHPTPMPLAPAGPDAYGAYGKVLFQMAADVPGSGSDLSSEEGSPEHGRKRKRSQ